MSANTQANFERAQTPEPNVVIDRLQHGYAAHLLSEPLVVTRWLMYGQSRLYVKTQQGHPIGWVDIHTGERLLEVPELHTAFEAAIAAAQPGIPAAYTPRRARLEQVASGHRPKGDSPEPRRMQAEPEQPVWSPKEQASPASAAKKGLRLSRVTAPRLTLSAPSASAIEPGEEGVPAQPVELRFGRIDALQERRKLRRGATELQLLAQQLNAFAGQEQDWDYLTAGDLGIEDAAVDFVVGGPGGIFAIDVITPTTASFRGTGFAKRAGQVLGRAMEAPVWVRHLLVPIGFSVADLAELPSELPLISRRQLPGFLASQPRCLSAGDVELALGYARLHWSWRN